MKKLIPVFVATLFAAGTALAQAPTPQQPAKGADSAATVPAKKSEVKKAENKSTKKAKTTKKSNKKNGKKSTKPTNSKKSAKKNATPAK